MKYSAWKYLAATTFFTLICSTPSLIAAFIAGAKASGMAATGIAYPQDAFAGAYNPAGIVEIGNRVDIGIDWIRDKGKAEVTLTKSKQFSPFRKSYNPFKSPNMINADLGINSNFTTEICGDSWDWAFGMVLYNHNYQKTSYQKSIHFLGSTKVGMEYIHEVLSPILSLRVNECHCIGMSVDVHLQRTSVKGLQSYANRVLSESPNHVTNKGYAYSSGVGVTLGWKWLATEALTVGAVYRSKVSMSKLHKYKGLFAEGGGLDTPEEWGLGLAYQFLPCSTFTFDVIWLNWQGVKSYHNQLHAHGRFKRLGSNEGPGFGFQNQIFYRFGIDYALNEHWTVRMGFRHTNPFIKKTQTFSNITNCDTIENYLSLGATYTYISNEFTIFYAYGFENTIRGKKAIPSFIGEGNVNLTESKNVLGLSWGYVF
jgi:long-chain fatty acid transport protein